MSSEYPSQHAPCRLACQRNVVCHRPCRQRGGILDLRQTKEFGRFQSVTIPVGRLPWGMALSAAGDALYVSNTGDNTISIVDLRLMRLGITVPAGKSPLGLAAR